VINVRTSTNVPDVKGVPDVPGVPGVPDMPDVPRNTAHNIFDTKNQTNEPDIQDVPNVRTSINVKIVFDVQDVIVRDVHDEPDVPDVPRTTAHNIFNTKGHQTNSWQTSPRQEFAAAATLAT
jgi:hypothetical protein